MLKYREQLLEMYRRKVNILVWDILIYKFKIR